MQKPLAKKVLLIGWDAADWKVINPLLDSGKMPALERFVNEGVMGNLATLNPILSPMLWTSIATGMRPFKHGIHGFTEPDPNTGGVRPVTNTSRQVKAVWNILNQNGYKSNVIGWWPSHPAEPINGVMVSNHYQRARAPIDKPWPMMPGTVHPADLAENLAELRIHPAELTPEQILPFIPKAEEIDQEKDRRLESFARILADCSTIHACATAVIQNEPWDFMAVYYDAIDHFGHGFMKYHPPRQDHIPEKDFEIYKDVVEGGYRFHDMMLGALLALAGEGTTVILISDHGFHPDHLRPARIPIEPAGPAAEHRPYGIFVMAGPGVQKDERIYGATLLDVAPTVLTLFGLPVGEDLDGKPLVTAFETPPEVETIPSWEAVKGEDGTHPPDMQMDPAEAQEAINQLVALGYIDDPGENREEAVRNTVREAHYNLAQSYIDANRHGDALPLLEALWQDWPEELRFANRLAVCYQALDRLADYRRTVEDLLDTQQRLARESREKLKEYQEKIKAAGEADDTASPPAEERGAERNLQAPQEGSLGETEAAPEVAESDEITSPSLQEGETEGEPEEENAEKLTPKERREIRRLRALARPSRYWRDYLMGGLLFAEEKHAEALEHLQRAEKAQPRLPNLHLQIGHIFMKMKKWGDAERAFRQALDIDPENAQGHFGLCLSFLPRRRDLEAAQEALTAVGLLYHYPQAHFHLGVALHRVGYLDRAVEALGVALSQNPNFAEAHQRLAYIYDRRLNNPEKAEYHRNQAKEIRQRQGEQRKARLAATSEIASPPKVGESAPPASIKPEPAPSPPPVAGAPDQTAPLAAATDAPRPATPSDESGQPITVVSGLPRSGTSMLMQMLHAGGQPCLTDGLREADPDNPRGYFEYEKVKRLRTDRSWFPEAQGKAVKIIAQLLPFLPPQFKYRVVFMDRDLDEVIASQSRMLERQERTGGKLSDERLRQVFERQVTQVKGMLDARNIPTLSVAHTDALEHPMEVAEQLRNFLGGDLEVDAMAAVVDSDLYRQRRTPSNA